MFNNIDIKKIKPSTAFIAKKVVHFEKVGSTNDVAKENTYEDGTLIIADTQTTGKGRLGREWVSENKSGIYMSIVLTPEISAEKISLLTLIAGISVCEALTDICNIPFKIKWPNDIVADGKKVCGILTEGIILPEKPKAIVGIGINVNQKSFADDLREKATSIYLLSNKNFDREIIINKVAEAFEKNYMDFIGNKPLKKKYESLCVNIDRKITATINGTQINATAMGITNNGELIVKKEDGTTLNINSGEVSVRGIYGYY